MDVVASVGKQHGPRDATQRLGGGDEQTVVRPHQQRPSASPNGQRSPLRPYPRVNDREIDRIPRHVARGVLEYLGTGLDLEPRNLVRQVHDGNPRRDAQHHALARADKVVTQPEVREEADGPHADQYKARISPRDTESPSPDPDTGRPQTSDNPGKPRP